VIALHVGTTPESDGLFRDELWRQLKRLDPPEEIHIRWPDGRAIRFTVEEDKS
jgi:hypothetical protein